MPSNPWVISAYPTLLKSLVVGLWDQTPWAFSWKYLDHSCQIFSRKFVFFPSCNIARIFHIFFIMLLLSTYICCLLRFDAHLHKSVILFQADPWICSWRRLLMGRQAQSSVRAFTHLKREICLNDITYINYDSIITWQVAWHFHADKLPHEDNCISERDYKYVAFPPLSYWLMKWIFHALRYYFLLKWIIALGLVSLINIVLHITQCEKPIHWTVLTDLSVPHQPEIWINFWFTFAQESYFYSDLAKRMRDFLADSSSSEYELLGWVI